jgi:hypothetical protein
MKRFTEDMTPVVAALMYFFGILGFFGSIIAEIAVSIMIIILAKKGTGGSVTGLELFVAWGYDTLYCLISWIVSVSWMVFGHALGDFYTFYYGSEYKVVPSGDGSGITIDKMNSASLDNGSYDLSSFVPSERVLVKETVEEGYVLSKDEKEGLITVSLPGGRTGKYRPDELEKM